MSCVDLARGGPGSIDVIEIDAASHGGVDDARDLRERAFFAPVSSRYKIYIVDEAHMVTTQGFNALLKLVEEPPPHVKFVFATTEPDKVIGTIRSRTHHYPFRLVPPKVLGDYLAHLCAAEGITVEPAVLPLVVRAGAGSVRDSLSVLDQLLGGASEDGVGYRQAAALLGYTPDSLLDEFVDAFAAGDAGGVFACVDKVIEVGQDPKRFAEDLLRRLRDLVIVAAVPDALTSGLVDVAADQAERLSSQVAALGAGELTRAAEVIAQGLTDMRGTTAPRLHLELMCARVLLPGADVNERGVHARLDRIERRLDMTGAAGAAVTPEAAPQKPVPTASPPSGAGPVAEAAGATAVVEARRSHHLDGHTGHPEPARRASAESPPTASPSERPRPEPVPADGPARNLGSAGGESDDTALGPHRQPPAAGPSGRQSLTVTDVRRLWPEVLEEVKGRRRFTWILLSQNAQVADVRDGVLVLAMAGVGPRDSFAKGGSEDILREALNEALGVDFRIEAIVDPSAAPPDAEPPCGRRQHPRRRPGARPPHLPASNRPDPPTATGSGRRRRTGCGASRDDSDSTRTRSRTPSCWPASSAPRSSARRSTAHRLRAPRDTIHPKERDASPKATCPASWLRPRRCSSSCCRRSRSWRRPSSRAPPAVTWSRPPSRAPASCSACVIKPEAVDPEDTETLADLVLAAVRDANNKVQAVTAAKLGPLAGGLGGGGLPF